MKIVILSDNFPPDAPGGAEQSVFGLAKSFLKKGHDVSIITTCRKKSDEGSSNYEGLRVFRIYSDYHERWRAYLSLYNPKTVGKVKKLLEAIKPDIVHANNIHWYLSYFCLKLARRYSKGVFITARDAMLFNYDKLATKRYLDGFDCRTSWLDHVKQARLRYNPFRNLITRHYLKYTDSIFAISEALKLALKENKIKNVEVVYNGIDLDNWQVGAEEIEAFRRKYDLRGRKVVLFGGRLSELKGGEEIVRAMEKVVIQVPDAVLLVAGKRGGYSQKMMRLAEELGIGENVILTDWLGREELKAAYFASNLAVVPSVYFDPFNLFNIEAMAARKPVVGTRFGGTPEIVLDGKTGFIVDPRDTAMMAPKISDLLKNPRKAEQFGEAGYLRVKEYFNLDKQADKYLEYFKRLLSD